jgi:hypothetical protein
MYAQHFAWECEYVIHCSIFVKKIYISSENVGVSSKKNENVGAKKLQVYNLWHKL